MFGGTNASVRPQPSRMRQSTRSRFSRYLRSFPRLEPLRSIRVTLSSLAKREIKVNVEGEGESPSPVKLIRERFRDLGKTGLAFLVVLTDVCQIVVVRVKSSIEPDADIIFEYRSFHHFFFKFCETGRVLSMRILNGKILKFVKAAMVLA